MVEEKTIYDVIVVGAGHAGIEAALLTAKKNLKTLLLSINMDNIALMPFGNDMGGCVRELIIRELNILGGEMPDNIVRSYINLNKERKDSEMVKVLVDERRYSLFLNKVLENKENLYIRQALAVDINKEGEYIRLKTSDGIVYYGKYIIIATGTFLGGRIYWGDYEMEAGRHGEICSSSFLRSLEKIGFNFGLLRRYVAPTVDLKTIKRSVLKKQFNVEADKFFLDIENKEEIKQKCSYSNRIGSGVVKYIKEMKREILNNGKRILEGKQLPIEGRIFKEESGEDREVIIQPLGRNTGEMYMKGMETALPEKLQLNILRKLKGFEKVEITRPGYGIEYNYMSASQLDKNLESKGISGIFFAGKVNGTIGYEESAAQGIIAGIGVSRKIRGIENVFLKKEDGCIGRFISNIAEGKGNSSLLGDDILKTGDYSKNVKNINMKLKNILGF
ncbi:MAG: FAD-dependent oxidoreductase [Actinomycetota bacterium]|nr:FAD-dependent oxidoreductase [Actinomycetota bacterium]